MFYICARCFLVDGAFINICLQELLNNAAHLAIFLNYVILNKVFPPSSSFNNVLFNILIVKDPAPLLFYLITDAYKAGSAREMRK